MTVADKGEEMGLIISRVEKQPRRSGDSPLKGPYEPHQAAAQVKVHGWQDVVDVSR